jgi:hypothetical protein
MIDFEEFMLLQNQFNHSLHAPEEEEEEEAALAAAMGAMGFGTHTF